MPVKAKLLCSFFFFAPFFSCLKQISGIFATALNRGLIQFELKADVHIIVYMTRQTLGKLISFWTDKNTLEWKKYYHMFQLNVIFLYLHNSFQPTVWMSRISGLD